MKLKCQGMTPEFYGVTRRLRGVAAGTGCPGAGIGRARLSWLTGNIVLNIGGVKNLYYHHGILFQ